MSFQQIHSLPGYVWTCSAVSCDQRQLTQALQVTPVTTLPDALKRRRKAWLHLAERVDQASAFCKRLPVSCTAQQASGTFKHDWTTPDRACGLFDLLPDAISALR